MELSGEDTVRFRSHSYKASAFSVVDFRHVFKRTVIDIVEWRPSRFLLDNYSKNLIVAKTTAIYVMPAYLIIMFIMPRFVFQGENVV